MARYCNNCGGKMDEDVAFCPECGQKVINDEQYNTSIQSINDDGQGMQQVTNFNTGHYDLTTNNNSNSNDISQPGKGFAIASLVLGIVSLLFIIFFPLVGLVVSIVGVVCAPGSVVFQATKSESSKGLAAGACPKDTGLLVAVAFSAEAVPEPPSGKSDREEPRHLLDGCA